MIFPRSDNLSDDSSNLGIESILKSRHSSSRSEPIIAVNRLELQIHPERCHRALQEAPLELEVLIKVNIKMQDSIRKKWDEDEKKKESSYENKNANSNCSNEEMWPAMISFRYVFYIEKCQKYHNFCVCEWLPMPAGGNSSLQELQNSVLENSRYFLKTHWTFLKVIRIFVKEKVKESWKLRKLRKLNQLPFLMG
jgi:hypothetical protein